MGIEHDVYYGMLYNSFTWIMWE